MFDPQPHLIKLPRKVKGRATGHYTTVYDDYLEVKGRLCWFRDRYPHGVIETAAEFADYCEWAETRALGRALAALGIGTQFVGQDLTEGDHVADAPVRPPAATNGHAPERDDIHCTGMPPDRNPPPQATRLSRDQVRALKQLAQTTFGYPEGARRLRHDLGFEPDERLTLRHLAAHVTVEQYQTLIVHGNQSCQNGLLAQTRHPNK
jgi:hypothetical protein